MYRGGSRISPRGGFSSGIFKRGREGLPCDEDNWSCRFKGKVSLSLGRFSKGVG